MVKKTFTIILKPVLKRKQRHVSYTHREGTGLEKIRKTNEQFRRCLPLFQVITF